jgi:threonine synthase
MPTSLPLLPESLWQPDASRSFCDTAVGVATAVLKDELLEADVEKLTKSAYDFDVPLVQLEENAWILELFHGPTLAFKDIGARFMAGLFDYYLAHMSGEITILVATSGDTGSAIAQAFWRKDGVRVVVLFPDGQVSERQRRQFTTLGENTTALAVQGTFDDCQALVKEAFSDTRLRKQRSLVSANSINIGRLIPQVFYYFHALSQLPPDQDSPPVISVPSGNCGNLTAGLMAQRMGLPVKRFCAATNINDVVPRYLDTGAYETAQSKRTISNAMDVGAPSNFERMTFLFGQEHAAMMQDVFGRSFTDEQTRSVIRQTFKSAGYHLDPHTAVGLLGLNSLRGGDAKVPGIVLATAHPAKFPAVVSSCTVDEVQVPHRLARWQDTDEKIEHIKPEYKAFRSHLLS